MLHTLPAHQIIAGDNDEMPASGARKRISSTAQTMEMARAQSVPASQIRRVQVEHLVPLGSGGSANDVEQSPGLINAGNPRVTRYCFVAPRTSAK